jgi:hypothetical protein
MDDNTEAKTQEILEKFRELNQRLKEGALEHPNAAPAKNMAERFKKWPGTIFSSFRYLTYLTRCW